MDEQRAEFEAWLKKNQLDTNPRYWTREYACWHAWQAATQRQQERIAELQAQVATLTTALFECREAFSIPEPGSPLEPAWMGAMTDPEDVPEYVKAQVQALSLDAGRTARNRDMWKGQTRRQADRLHDLHTCMAAIKRLLARDPCAHANTAIQMIDAAIAAGKEQT